MVQVVGAGPDPSVTPETVIVLEPGVAVTVPPQVLASPLGVAIVIPVGRLSVKPIPLSANRVLLFLIVNVSEVGVFRGRNGEALAPKAFVSTGACTEGMVPTPLPMGGVTVSVAEEPTPAGASLDVT